MITPSYAPTATERVLPRLALDFTTGVLDPRVTVARALNTATRVNSSGFVEVVNANLPRFDYDPSTLASKGLLVEEQRANLLLYSNEFTNAVWTAAGGSVSLVSGASPDGSSSVYKFTPSAPSASFRELQQSVSVTLGTTYCFSQYVKADSYKYVQVLGNSAAFGNFNVNFDLSTGTETAFNAGTSTVVARGIINCGNGFYRVWAAVTALASTSGRMAVDYIETATSARGAAWVADGVNGYQIYGAQMEVGAFPTSYIPTTAASLTRNADVVTMTGTNFTSWYNTSEGAVFSEVTLSNLTKSQGAWAIGDSSLGFGSGRMMYAESSPGASGKLTFNVFNNGAQQVFIQPNVVPVVGTPIRSVFAYKSNDYAASVSASSPSTGGGAIPAVTSMSIGSLESGWSGATQYMNGHVRKIFYWPQRLINAEVQAFSK